MNLMWPVSNRPGPLLGSGDELTGTSGGHPQLHRGQRPRVGNGACETLANREPLIVNRCRHA